MSEYWIQTYTGVRFDLLVPKPESVELIDIAHAVSMLCRFTGHSKFHYSVAEHCLNVSLLVENFCRRTGMSAKDGAHAGLEALLHDAAEAYIGDLSRPMKQLLRTEAVAYECGGRSKYDKIEDGIHAAIWKRYFDVTEMRNRDLVKRADVHMLAVEARQVLDGGVRHSWSDPQGLALMYDPDFAIPRLTMMSPETARRMFVMRFDELMRVIEGRECFDELMRVIEGRE